MRSLLAVLLLLGLYASVIGQQTNPSSAQIQEVMQRMHAQLDSAYKSPQVKKMMQQGKEINTDSIVQAARNRAPGGAAMVTGGMGIRPDTNFNTTLPKRNAGALGALSPKTLSTPELKTYVTGLEKSLAAVLRARNISVPNTDELSPEVISNASVLAAAKGYIFQAAMLGLRAAELAPDDPFVLNNTGDVLHQGGLDVAAITVLEAALPDDPTNSTITNNIGQSYLALGDQDKARQYLQQSVAADPEHPLANSSLALIDINRGDRGAALKHVENSLRGAFTDRSWHLLYKLKKDPVLMDYFKARYKQPEYFDENKYPLPLQCDRVSDIGKYRAEYDAYKEMLRRVKKKFDDEGRQEGQKGKDAMMQQIKNHQSGARNYQYQAPFTELANAMLLDLSRRMEKDDADQIARSQKEYHDRISQYQDEYNRRYHDVHECSEQIGLANECMERMSVATHVYQKTYLRIYKDFYLDNAYWSFFTTNDAHMRRSMFCRLTSGFLSVLLQIAETHFLDVTIDCNTEEKEKKEAAEVEIEADCPLYKQWEIPFVIGKINIDCEKAEIEFGEAFVFNGSYNFGTGETILALGPGVAVSLVGGGHHSLKKVPQLKQGPLSFGAEAGIKGQVFIDIKDGAVVDWGGKFEAELDIKGLAPEFKTGYSIGAVSGLQMTPGALKDAIDEHMGPQKEAPQMNKNVKIYNPK